MQGHSREYDIQLWNSSKPFFLFIICFSLMKIDIFDIKLLIIVIMFMKGSLVLGGH